MIRRILPLLSIAILALATTWPLRAETLLIAQTGLFTGQQSYIVPLHLSGPGELKVRLTDLGWLGRLSDLSFSLSQADGLLSQIATDLAQTPPGTANSGLQTYDIDAAGTYYAYISGRATGPYNIGLYSLNVGFAAADASPVPLPAAAWLLLSGLGFLGGWKRFSRGNYRIRVESANCTA